MFQFGLFFGAFFIAFVITLVLTVIWEPLGVCFAASLVAGKIVVDHHGLLTRKPLV